VRIDITEHGQAELSRLGFHIRDSIARILECVPSEDTIGIGRIIITDVPVAKGISPGAQAAYNPGGGKDAPSIGIYLKNLFHHIRSAHSFRNMIPIQEFGLANAIFHEIGHHVRNTLTHGIRLCKDEAFANSYAERMLDRYILYNTGRIDDCFGTLEALARKGELSPEVVTGMKEGWEIRRSRANAK